MPQTPSQTGWSLSEENYASGHHYTSGAQAEKNRNPGSRRCLLKILPRPRILHQRWVEGYLVDGWRRGIDESRGSWGGYDSMVDGRSEICICLFSSFGQRY